MPETEWPNIGYLYPPRQPSAMQIGQYNRLTVDRVEATGTLLRDPASGKVATLPPREEPEDLRPGSSVKAFVYVDGEGHLLASLAEPKAVCDSFAYLEVVEVTPVGAFLDWGLPKDLLAPFSEQPLKMQKGRSYVVYVYLDEASGRPVASARLQRFLQAPPSDLKRGQEVELLITHPSELGRNVIIDDRYPGLLFHSDITRVVKEGDRLSGYIKKVKEDQKIDVSLQRTGYARVLPQAEKILEALRDHNGFLPLHDKSDPNLIFENLQMSKKTFKKAVGALYRQRKIRIADEGIYLRSVNS